MATFKNMVGGETYSSLVIRMLTSSAEELSSLLSSVRQSDNSENLKIRPFIFGDFKMGLNLTLASQIWKCGAPVKATL